MTSCIFHHFLPPVLFLSIPFNNYCSALFAQGVSFEGPCCGFCLCCCMFQNTTPLSLSSISQRFCELAFLPRMSSVCGQAAVTQAPLETSHCWLLVMFHTFLQIPRIRWGLRNFWWRGLLGCFCRLESREGVGHLDKWEGFHIENDKGRTICIIWDRLLQNFVENSLGWRTLYPFI